jgi:hypothetical protein
MKLEDITLSKAHNIWAKASTFNHKVYKIMMYIIKKEDLRCLINRNPTLNYYSMLLMKIRKVKAEGFIPSEANYVKDCENQGKMEFAEDYALSVPLSILKGLNADFDGDILNIIGLVDPAIVYMFRKFDPIKRMIISRDDDLLNSYFSITNGQLIDLEFFATMGPQPNDEEETYPVKDNETGETIYVPKSEIKKYKSGIVEPVMFGYYKIEPKTNII